MFWPVSRPTEDTVRIVAADEAINYRANMNTNDIGPKGEPGLSGPTADMGAKGPVGSTGATTPVKLPKAIKITRAKAQPSAALGKLFVKGGLVPGIETSIVLAPDVDHMEVIAALAADAIAVEKTSERRMVLEAIRVACERTRSLQMQREAAPQ